jgi:hypothetical protein
LRKNPPNTETVAPLKAVVSGGETGADRAALDFAIETAIRHFGFCPQGRPSEDGRIPLRYALVETLSEGVSESIFLNVSASDGTVLFDPLPAQRGLRSTCVTAFCKSTRRPLLILQSQFDVKADARQLTRFLNSHRLTSLYITGCTENEAPGIYQHVSQVQRSLILEKDPPEISPASPTTARTGATADFARPCVR